MVKKRLAESTLFRPALSDSLRRKNPDGLPAQAPSTPNGAARSGQRKSNSSISCNTQPKRNNDVLLEYNFAKGTRGKHHGAYRGGANAVFLDADVAKTPANSEQVNETLRMLLQLAKGSVPRPRSA